MAKRKGGALRTRTRTRTRVVVKRVGSRARSAVGRIPKPGGMQIGKLIASVFIGRAIKERVDLPFVPEQALGFFLLMFLGGSAAEKRALLEVGLALSIVTVADEQGWTQQIGLPGPAL